jgi:hypothetical protein
MRIARLLAPVSVLAVILGLVACSEDSTSAPPSNAGTDGGGLTFEASAPFDAGPGNDTGAPPQDSGAPLDAGKVIPPGLLEPIPYLSRADSPFNGVHFGSYSHFEDWEDGAMNTPGVTASSTQVGSDFGAALIDSVDGDDGVVDGKCEKAGSNCNSGFAGNTIEFTFDATALGALPTHVGIAWTDGSPGCDAIFEAFDATDTSLGSKTAAAVGDVNNSGGPGEDRFFAIVHAAGVKKIVVKSSAGGIEVDHLTYGR